MRAPAVISLAFICMAFALGSASAEANPGDEISKFLKQITDDRLPIAIYGLDTRKAVTPGASPPTEEVLLQAVNWPLTLTSKCPVEARDALKKALAVAPLSAPGDFRPDYCIVYREPEEVTKVLWIDSSKLQMQLYVKPQTQIYVSGRLFPLDISGIQTSAPAGSDVHVALEKFIRVAREPLESMLSMIGTIGHSSLPLELCSIDPKQTVDVFGKKHWSILGRLPIVCRAINYALDKDAMPAYTAHDFKPRLAVSAWIPDRSGKHYVLLMSFDCRLAELYVDEKSRGCCGISSAWAAGTIQKLPNPGLAIAIAPDQTLNDILVAASKPLKPKSTSSGN
jgi:hypothetical protein